MQKLITSCITILILATPAYTKLQTQISAQEIINRMAEVYAHCRTYSDEGEVTTEYVGGSRSMTLRRQPFFTAFVRPSNFRFEFSRPGRKGGWDRFIAWKDGDVENSWWGYDSGAPSSTLDRALFSFGSLSEGAALTAPSLLFPTSFADGVLSLRWMS